MSSTDEACWQLCLPSQAAVDNDVVIVVGEFLWIFFLLVVF
jgi:hypothetical protein